MAANMFRRMLASRKLSAVNKMFQTRHYSIYEPDYLEAIKPKYPLYPTLLVQLKGYDFPVLESYQSWVHKIADVMDFDVEDSYPMPAKNLKIIKYKEKSTAIEMEYFLNVYRRDLKISNVASVRLPIFIRVLETALPEGVTLNIEEYNLEKEKLRYVPDKTLLDLKSELQEIGDERKKKKKK